MYMPTTLAAAAAAALINLWLAMRIGQLRHRYEISVGDGGNEALARRMRAQLNFAENTPIVLVLIAGIEFAGAGDWWLPLIAMLYMLARIAHGVGMDGEAGSLAALWARW